MANNKKTFFKKFLTTASAFAVIAGASGDAMGAAVARRTSGNAVAVDLTVGTSLSGPLTPFTTGSTLEFSALKDVDVNLAVNILAVDVHGQNLSGNGHFFNITEDVTIGSIVDLGAAGDALVVHGAANKVQMKFGVVKTLTLDGKGSDVGVLGFAAHPGSATAGENAPVDNYSALGLIDFDDNAATLSIAADSGNAITLHNASIDNAAGNGAILEVATDLIVHDASFATIDHTELDNGVVLTINAGKNDIATTAASDYTFGNGDSTLAYNVDVGGANQTIDFLSNIVDAGGAADEDFKISFGTTGAGNALTVTATGGVKTIGTDNANRAKSLTLEGANNITFSANVGVFAKSIVQAGTGETTFTNVIDSGAGSTLTFAAAGGVKFLGVGNNEIAIADFAGNAGTITLADGANFAGTVDSTVASAGNLLLEGDTVTGAVGATNALTSVKLTGANGTTGTFTGQVEANELELTAGADAQLDGGAVIGQLTIGDNNSHVKIIDANTLEFTGANDVAFKGGVNDIVFDGDDSAMKFNAVGGKQLVVNVTDLAFNTGADDRGIITLHADGDDGGGPAINSSLTVTGFALGGANTLQEVAITGDKIVKVKNAGINTVTLSIAAGSTLEYTPTANVSFNAVTLANANSVLKLEANAANRTFTMNANIDPGGNGQGIIELASNGNVAILDGNGGVKTLGTGGNHIAVLNITGASEGVITANVNITNVNELNIKNGASLSSLTNTAAAIAAINIGEAGGVGTLVIDANAGDYDLLNGTAIVFAHNDSLLKLTNSKNADRVVTLYGDVAPGGVADVKGRLEINSAGANDLDLDINGVETIGTNNAHRLKEFIVSGDQDVIIAPAVFAKTITISSTAGLVTFEAVIDSGVLDNSIIKFTADGGDLKIEAEVTAKTLDINGKTRTVTVADGVDLNFDDILAGANSTLTFEGDNELKLFAAKTVTVGIIKAAELNAVTTKLGAGTYTVGDIQLGNAGGTLELADGFELTGGINVAAGNAGIVKFLGNGKVTGVLGGAANATGAVTVEGNSTLELGDNVNVASLKGANAANQNLSFINAGNIEVTGDIGGNAGTEFTKISFSGNKVDFKTANALHADNPLLHFTADTEVVTIGYDLDNTDITNANGINNSKFVVNIDQVITGNIGTLAQPFGAIHVSAAAVLDTDVSIDTANFFAGITGAKAKAIFNDVGSSVSFLGKAGAPIKSANFATNGAVHGAVHAETIDVRAGQVATFNDVVFDGNAMKMHAANAQADFTAKVILDMPIVANAAGDGIINFNGGVVLNSHVGADGTRVAAVTIGGDSTISADLHANAITVGAHELTLTKAATFNGVTGFNATTLKLTDHDLTMKSGDVTFTGASKIETTVTGDKLGNLVAGVNSKIILAGADTLEVVVDDAAALPVNGQNLKLIAKTGNGALNMDVSKITVTATGAFSQWKKSIIDNEFVLTQNSQIQEVISEAIAEAGLSNVISKEVAEAIESYEEDTKGEEFALQLNQMTKPNIADAVARTANTTSNEVAAVNLEVLNEITAIVSNRIAEIVGFAAPSFTPTNAVAPTGTAASQAIDVSSENSYVSGVAAGDDHDRFGIWATPFYSKATQKKRSGTSGFKAESYGGTFGFDTKASDDMILGMAFSAMNTDIKHKDFKSGDKTKVTSYLVSIYGTQRFTNNWFGQGVFSMGSSSVNNKENRRISNTQLAIAEGKYTSMTFAAEVLGGYNHMVNNQFAVTPMFGLNYNRINDGSYNESGKEAGPQLMEVTKKASQKLDIVGGVKLTAMPYMLNDVTITPEAHVFIRHDVIGKGAKVDAKIPGLKLPSEKAKLQKTFYNVGASLNVAYGAMDYGISTDANFADKYVAVQGALKLRVNF